MFMILWVKTYLSISYLEKFLTNFQVLPLVTESWHMGKTGETAVSYIPCKILYISINVLMFNGGFVLKAPLATPLCDMVNKIDQCTKSIKYKVTTWRTLCTKTSRQSTVFQSSQMTRRHSSIICKSAPSIYYPTNCLPQPYFKTCPNHPFYQLHQAHLNIL